METTAKKQINREVQTIGKPNINSHFPINSPGDENEYSNFTLPSV